MTSWRLFKKHPDSRTVAPAGVVEVPCKFPAPPQPPTTEALTHRRRASSIHSRHSSRSSRSNRSSGSRTLVSSAGSQRRTSRSRAARHSMPNCGERRCFACARTFKENHCGTCETTYDPIALLDHQPLDFTLAFDLAANDNSQLLEQVICDTFSSMEATVPCFVENGVLSAEKIDMLYEILATPTSTTPMRAVLQGAQVALLNRPYQPLSYNELLYLLIVLKSPVFTQCSMFTKITGPLQKLGRYSSFRSRARIVLDISMGLLSNIPPALNAFALQYLGDLEMSQFQSGVDLLNSYIGHRLTFHFSLKSPPRQQIKGKNDIKVQWYADDWRIASAAKVLSLYFQASTLHKKLPVSCFYNMISDHIDLGSDYDAWQAQVKRRGALTNSELWHLDPTLMNKFSFCEYSFLLTITSKSAVFRHSLNRKVREYQLQQQQQQHQQHQSFNRASTSSASSVYSNPHALATNAANSAIHAAWAFTQQPKKDANLHILIHRDHLLADSMSLLIAKTACDLKKPLRVEFHGEPGIDAGGLCKEWVHLLFNELTSPEMNLFVQEEDSLYNWFGTSSDLDSYMVLGIALGLSLNNGMMVESYMPPLAYKLLLDMDYTIDDIACVWPTITNSLNSILNYEGKDVEDVFGLTFVCPDGTPMRPDGENIAVTVDNREQYVHEMLKYMTRATDQFSSFKSGFMRTCDTPALKLFTPTEMESLIRGERKPIDVDTLRNNTRYLHWGSRQDIAKEPVIIWFWDFFKSLDPEKQALLLVFITATPRIPATGISSMQFRISCLGPDSDRLPIAHTCFNQLGLYRYRSRKKLYKKLTQAITECQSFGIK